MPADIILHRSKKTAESLRTEAEKNLGGRKERILKHYVDCDV